MNSETNSKFYGKAKHWDNLFQPFEDPKLTYTGKKWAAHFLPLIERVKAQKVIDLGCGLGYDSILLAEQGYEVTGIDFSQEAINHAILQANKMDLSVNFNCLDLAQKLPFDGQQFDVAISNMVLHSFPPMVLSDVVEDIHRIIKPGGYLLFHANSIKDLPLRTQSQGPVTKLGHNFFELKGGQSMHFLDSNYCSELFKNWGSLELEPVTSLNEDGKVLKYAWRGIARKKSK